MNDKLVSIAMNIILHAGDARKLISEAGDNIANLQLNKAEKKLQSAHESILLAHKAQTNLLQKEANGENIPYSILFNHAQDTLMATTTEFNCTKQLIKLVKTFIKNKQEEDIK
ncbi:MAG: PTS lactose/cellobiose transporter subunit IIA [Lactobacillus sp.]|uniref:PTS lactose/cellobiose transporter subunit IIA n=2 Tax=Bombilactobacillus bombi TaxID=1303590 RepID=A0A3R6V7R5_9LACO|nr:PTS lactose/cellobiose transporter subunit IIA [Lactobacillus sp.]RHW48440.1 PTS lactose/cellobiose transporter subunit IIA [Bombilactobacillus bombi]